MLMFWKYGFGIPSGALLADAGAVQESADTLELAQRYGDDLALEATLFMRGLILAQQDRPRREEGLRLLGTAREAALERSLSVRLAADRPRIRQGQGPHARFRRGDRAASCRRRPRIALRKCRSPCCGDRRTWWSRCCVEGGPRHAGSGSCNRTVGRRANRPRICPERIWLLRLRALLAQAHGDDAAYRDYRDRYRAMATSLGFEGHMEWAEAMP